MIKKQSFDYQSYNILWGIPIGKRKVSETLYSKRNLEKLLKNWINVGCISVLKSG